jgi:acyl carrier protein
MGQHKSIGYSRESPGEVVMQQILNATMVAELLREVGTEMQLDLAGVAADTSLDDLGMDSLDRVELLTALEDKTGYRFPDERVSEIATIDDVIECVLELQRERQERAPDQQEVSNRQGVSG